MQAPNQTAGSHGIGAPWPRDCAAHVEALRLSKPANRGFERTAQPYAALSQLRHGPAACSAA